jgi:hypothetical protein
MGASLAAMQITEEDRNTYERDGVVCVREAFSPEWLAFLTGACEEAIASPGPHAEYYVTPGSSGRFFGDIELSPRLTKFLRFVRESPATEIAGRIMGASRVNFFYDQLLVKEPGTSERHTVAPGPTGSLGVAVVSG